MAIYTVHNRKAARSDDAVFVKEGFAWGAFIFTLFWALWNRMWIVAAIVLAATAAIAALGSWLGLGSLPINLASLALGLVLGFEGNDLRRWSLIRRGYQEVGMAAGRTIEEAELRYFATVRQLGIPGPGASPVQNRPETHDPLGLFGAAG